MKPGWHSKNRSVVHDTTLVRTFDWLEVVIQRLWLVDWSESGCSEFRLHDWLYGICMIFDWLSINFHKSDWTQSLDLRNCPATALQLPDNRALFFGDCWLVIEPELRTLIGYTSNRSGSEACDWVMSLWWRTPGSLAQSPPGCLYIAPMKIIYLSNRG